MRKNGNTWEQENIIYNEKIANWEKKFKIKINVIWACEFQILLRKDENREFFEDIYPNLYFWKRLCARDAQVCGLRMTFCHKWTKFENPTEKLHFLDINGAYLETCLKFSFPFGKINILIDKSLKNEKIDIHDGKLMSKKSNKMIFGLIKAKILPSQQKEPFFPFKHRDRNYHVFCKKCLELDLQTQCNHSDKERSYEVTTTGKFCK